MLAPPQGEKVYCPYANALSINQLTQKRQLITKRRSRGIQSIDTGIRLLEVMEKADGALALKELSAAADLDPSSAHRYLASFVRCGLVRQESDSRYDFGPLALHIGLAAVRRLDPVQLTERALPQLVKDTGYTALLSVWSNRGPTVVHWQRGPSPFVTNLGLGSVLPVSRSATGAVFVAFLPATVTAEALSAEARRETIDRDAFARVVERARKTRLAFVDNTVIPGLAAVSSPVLQWNGDAAAAVTLIGRDPQLARASHPAAGALRRLCDRLSKDFGARDLEAAAA
jgi:DNA-binding IclR family transcriptional regulator